MPFKTQYGSHYHMTEGCHGATIPCDTKGLTPCSDCCGKGSDRVGGGSPRATSALAGGGSAGITDGIPFSVDSEDAGDLLAEGQGPATQAGTQGEPLDAYDGTTAATHDASLVESGAQAISQGRPAPEPQYGIEPEAFAAFTDAMSDFGIEPLACPERVPDTWGDSEPAPSPLPNWDAPVRSPGEYWFYEMAAASPDPLLSKQVAAAVAPAMDRWPGATAEMLRYGIRHGFMTAPASTCFHLNTPGGLACHSASVTACAIEMLESPEYAHVREELGPDWREITSVVCLWHDACKLDFYEPLDHPRQRPDGRVAFYGVAKKRQNDPRHGELSEDIVRHFYGKALPEVAYEAISMHMGPYDHRRSIPKWVSDTLDDDVQRQRREADAERRAKQDADVASGKIWWQLRNKVSERRELAQSIKGKSESEAAEIVAGSSDSHSKRMFILLDRLQELEGTGDPLEAEYHQEIRDMLRSYEAVGESDDIAVAQGILIDDRAHYDASQDSKRRRALQAKERAEAFAQRMEQVWEERPFVRLIHEADAKSAGMGR